jgi:hypothetical protein
MKIAKIYWNPEKKYLLFGNGASKAVSTIIVDTTIVL